MKDNSNSKKSSLHDDKYKDFTTRFAQLLIKTAEYQIAKEKEKKLKKGQDG